METRNISRVVACDYCGKPAKLVRGFVIYPHRKDLSDGYYWSCDPCGAYVGCHRDSDAVPLGRLAIQLRAAKRLAHAAFDPLWKEFGMKRPAAYEWLAEQLGSRAPNVTSECSMLICVAGCSEWQRITEKAVKRGMTNVFRN